MPLQRRLPPWALSWSLALTLLLSASSGRAGWWFLTSTLILALALMGPRRTLLAALPGSVVLSACLIIAGLVVADAVGAAPLASATHTRVLLLLLSAALLPLLRGRPTLSLASVARRCEVCACLPSVALLVVTVILAAQALPTAANGLLTGWDNGAHLLSAAQIQRAGGLSYDVDAYPRGLHALVALAVAARADAEVTPALLAVFLQTYAVIFWLLYVLFSAVVSLTALAVAEVLKLPARQATVVAAAAGLATLTPGFFRFTFVYGFATSVALAFLLGVASLEVMTTRLSAAGLPVLGGTVMATAHSWQLALPLAAVPLLLSCRHAGRWGAADRAALAICLIFLAMAAPPMIAVIQRIGPSAVAMSGELDPLPTGWFAAGIAAALWFLLRRAQAGRLRTMASMVLLASAMGAACAAMAGVGLDSYYPRKVLWHAAALSLPLSAGLAGLLYISGKRRLSTTFVLRFSALPVGAVALLSLAVLGVIGPYLAASGGWNVPDDVVGALLQPQDELSACRLESDYARRVTYRVLNFYESDAQAPPPTQGPLPTCPSPPSRP